MADGDQGMMEFLGVPADRSLLGAELAALPDTAPPPAPTPATRRHDRLVRAGSAMTAVALIGGAALALYGGEQLLFGAGGTLAALVAVIGLLLVGTHWGWVHVAEYAGLTIDERRQHADAEREDAWLTTVAPYPRFSIRTSVLGDASTRVQRVLDKPTLTPRQTFTFVRETDAEQTFDAFTPAAVIAAEVETMRRQARLETERLRELWEAAGTAYAAEMLNAADDQQRLVAQRAAATALSEHMNASLLEPPLIE